MSFRLFGTRVFLSFWLILAFTAALILDRDNRFLSCFLAAGLHETGHLLLMRIEKVPPTQIRLGLLDIKIVSEKPDTKRACRNILLAGPLMNLLAAALTFSFSRTLFGANLALGIFNLLPIESLDGGELLRLMLKDHLSDKALRLVMHIVAFSFLLPLFFFGILVLLKTRYNVSLLLVSLYLFAVLIERRPHPFFH